MEDAGADDAGPRARHLRRRAAWPWRAERRRHPAAAHLHDGPDVGHRDAVVHLLGCAVRRRHYLDPVQHSGRGVVGCDHLRRLSDGAAGPGGGSAHRRVHVILHRLAGRRAADHVPCAQRRRLRAALRAAGILRRLFAHLLFVCRARARGQAQDHHLHDARAHPCGHRHGHGVRPIAHDVRLERAFARRQFPRRRHRPVRHQRNSAHHGGAARVARPRRQHQPARRAQGVEGDAALLGDAGALLLHRLLARHHTRRRDCGVVHGLQPRQAFLQGPGQFRQGPHRGRVCAGDCGPRLRHLGVAADAGARHSRVRAPRRSCSAA